MSTSKCSHQNYQKTSKILFVITEDIQYKPLAKLRLYFVIIRLYGKFHFETERTTKNTRLKRLSEILKYVYEKEKTL